MYNSKYPEQSGVYAPALLGNGSLSFAINAEGALNFPYSKGLPQPMVFRAARRLSITHDRGLGQIVSFGTFSFDKQAEVASFTQDLIAKEGHIVSSCEYSDGTVIDSVCFMHPDKNLYGMKKTFHGPAQTINSDYELRGYNKDTEDVILSANVEPNANGADIGFDIFGMDRYRGKVSLFLDKPARATYEGKKVRLSCDVEDGDELCFFLALEDDLSNPDYAAFLENLRASVLEQGFDSILEECISIWREYFSHGYAKTSDETLNAIYETALYHLKCNMTENSMAIGINDNCWDAKFFAFDEYYGFLGLLGANQTQLAKHVPAFRVRKCTEKAFHRMSHYNPADPNRAARFCWETSEYGEELAIPGKWHDHVFHMPLIAMGAYDYYEHSMDLDFLKEAYSMIKGCAMYFTTHMLYEENGQLILGYCCDLERLGNSRKNAFMSQCGTIALLECYVKTADLLDMDPEYREECAQKAKRLRESLPREDGRYVPYPGCPHRSIGVFSGKFPYNVLSADDELMNNAWVDYAAHELEYGNMYSVGKNISPWYACWKAEGFARSHKGEEAYASLKQAYRSAGAFHNMYEICEPTVQYRPWFATAAGIFASAVNEMLLKSDGENIYVLPAFPDEGKPLSFKLSVKGGAVCSVSIEDGKIASIEVTMKEGIPAKNYTVHFKGETFVAEGKSC
jgi:hypothetical protein